MALASVLVRTPAEAATLPERMSVLDNGILKIGMDLNRGGAVTYLEAASRPGNLINNSDYGRQIQMSVYSGPIPFTPHGKQPRPEWRGLGWNPIQTGDCFGRPARVVDQRNDGTQLYVKLVPMQWPLDDEPGECTFETWTTLAGSSVHMRFRVTLQRSDQTQYPARNQELPAVYAISALHRVLSYTGDRPFTGDAVSELHNDWTKPWPWTVWTATEGWSAMVGDDDWGIGVFRDDGCQFNGGLYGKAGSTDPHGSPTTYLAPVEVETLDHDIVYEHACDLVVGSLTDIRARCISLADACRCLPSWRFTGATRQHWHVDGATDAGLPQLGSWRIHLGEQVPRLTSPCRCWAASAAPRATVTVTWAGPPTVGRFYWRRIGASGWDARRSLPVALLSDSQPHMYVIPLGESDEYRGEIMGVAFDPVGEPHPGLEMAIDAIAVGSAGR
jgi:hypothetical protein